MAANIKSNAFRLLLGLLLALYPAWSILPACAPGSAASYAARKIELQQRNTRALIGEEAFARFVRTAQEQYNAANWYTSTGAVGLGPLDTGVNFLGEFGSDFWGLAAGMQIFYVEDANDIQTCDTVLVHENATKSASVFAGGSLYTDYGKITAGWRQIGFEEKYSEQEIEDIASNKLDPLTNGFERGFHGGPYLFIATPWNSLFRSRANATTDAGKLSQLGLAAFLHFFDIDLGPAYDQGRVVNGRQHDVGMVAMYGIEKTDDRPTEMGKHIRVKYGQFYTDGDGAALNQTTGNSRSHYALAEWAGETLFLGSSYHGDHGLGLRGGIRMFILDDSILFTWTVQFNYVMDMIWSQRVNDFGMYYSIAVIPGRE